MEVKRLLMACVLALAACDPGAADDVGSETVVREPGAFQAGFASRRIPAPLGIGTGGFNGIGSGGPDSPYAQFFPATNRLFGHPSIKATVLSRGEGFEAILVRLDTVGVFSEIRLDLAARLQAELGRDVSDELLLMATHTHAGPGRLSDRGGIFGVLVDVFFPAYYERFMDALVQTVLEAYDDLAPAELGSGMGSSRMPHSDRRCEDGETYTNDDVPILAVRRDGMVDGLLFGFAVHPVIFGLQTYHLSQDLAGGLEYWVEDGFDHPVHVQYVNSWAGDMTVGEATVKTTTANAGDDRYARTHAVGATFAEDLHGALEGLNWTSEPTLGLHTRRVPVDREALGYEGEDEFPYPYGGSQCQAPNASCESPTQDFSIDEQCIGFPGDTQWPDRATLTVGQIGDFGIVTFPGEAVTRLAEATMAAIQAEDPSLEHVFYMGYAQDYMGYGLLEEDWYYGGYETEGGLWGPRFGPYLMEQSVAVFRDWKGTAPLPQAVEPLPLFESDPSAVVVAERALKAGTVVAELPSVLNADDRVSFTVLGGDPWLGTPLVSLVHEDGSPVLRANGTPVDSDGLYFDVSLEVTPTYEEAMPAERTFAWTFSFSGRSHVSTGLDLTGGRYRLVASLPIEEGLVPLVLETAVFTVE